MRPQVCRYTRGSGLLEGFLARRRACRADGFIKEELRQGRVLDVGCGTTPFFLLNTRFCEKHGVDPQAKYMADSADIKLQPILIDRDLALPFPDAFFSVIVSLGTLEHFDEAVWRHLLREAYRLLQPGGQLILTTPSPWTHGLLKAMAGMNMISFQEIQDARHIRSTNDLRAALAKAGFKKENILDGTFQFGMNRWFCAVK